METPGSGLNCSRRDLISHAVSDLVKGFDPSKAVTTTKRVRPEWHLLKANGLMRATKSNQEGQAYTL